MRGPAHLFLSDTINQMGLQTYCYIKFFERRMGYPPLSTLCSHTMAIIDQYNAEMPFVVTAYLAL